jgi:hypothetical protein
MTNNVVFAETINNVIPDDTYDETDSWAVGSRIRNLVTGNEYVCTSANEGDAIWIQSGIVPFKQAVTNAEILAETTVDIADLPTCPEGYAWRVIDAGLSFTPGLTAFDGGGRVKIAPRGSTSSQWVIAGAVFTTLDQIFITANTAVIADATDGSNIIDGAGMAIFPEGMEDGDGDLIIYGSARLITL